MQTSAAAGLIVNNEALFNDGGAVIRTALNCRWIDAPVVQFERKVKDPFDKDDLFCSHIIQLPDHGELREQRI